MPCLYIFFCLFVDLFKMVFRFSSFTHSFWYQSIHYTPFFSSFEKKEKFLYKFFKVVVSLSYIKIYLNSYLINWFFFFLSSILHCNVNVIMINCAVYVCLDKLINEPHVLAPIIYNFHKKTLQKQPKKKITKLSSIIVSEKKLSILIRYDIQMWMNEWIIER